MSYKSFLNSSAEGKIFLYASGSSLLLWYVATPINRPLSVAELLYVDYQTV